MGTEPHQREALASVGTYWMLVDVLEESNASELGKKDPQRLSLCSTLDIYIYIYTLNLSDPCFGGATIQNMAVSYQKGGQMGSRCIYIYIYQYKWNNRHKTYQLVPHHTRSSRSSHESFAPAFLFVPGKAIGCSSNKTTTLKMVT